jgi:putative methyltransferase (TIGR04325 family)
MGEAIFLGKFKNYLECQKWCHSKNEESERTVFPQDIWRRRQMEELEKQRSGRGNRSESISKALNIDTFYNIVDFGGGSGWLFEKIKSIQATNFHYYLIETAESLQTFENINEQRKAFTNFMAASLAEFEKQDLTLGKNILYINSVLQYIEEPIKQIENILKVYPSSTIIFDDLVNSKKDDFWSCQRYYDYLVPYHFVNLSKFIDSISQLGFRITKEVDYDHTFSDGWECRIDNFGEEIDLDSPKSLIFDHSSTEYKMVVN